MDKIPSVIDNPGGEAVIEVEKGNCGDKTF